MRILFVCLGNICRSPLAEAALRDEAQKAGLQIEVASAGTGDWHVGEPPDPRAQATAQEHGLDISGYRGRQVSAADFTTFDLILAMDHDNLVNLEAIRPQNASAQLGLLLDHVEGREGQAVTDPYFGGNEGFSRTWSDVRAAAKALIDRLQNG